MTWSATEIGLLSGGTYSIAEAATSDGAVIVGAADTGSSSGASHAFSWTSGGGMVDLGILSGGSYSIARAVSPGGTWIVGEADDSTGNPNAVLWHNGVGPVALNRLTSGTQASAYAISADGSTVGGYSNNGSGTVLPCTWATSGPGSPVSLGLFGSNVAGIATGLSTNGSIAAGGSDNLPDVPWIYDGGLSAIPLPGSEIEGGVQALTPSALAAAGTAYSPGNGEPFIWQSGVGSSLLGLPSGANFGFAQSITNDGLTIVGNAGTYPSLSVGWVWSNADGFTTLPPLAGGSTTLAYGISPDGSVIVGRSLQSGAQIAVYWTQSSPPATPFLTVAELWFGPTSSFVDLTAVANRRKFISSSGGAQNLGIDGSLPFLVAPPVFLSRQGADSPAEFAANRGRGGPFNISGGTLSNGVSNPPGTFATVVTATAVAPGQGVLGDYRNGNLYIFNPAQYTDNGTQRKWIRRWRALAKTTNRAVSYGYLVITMETGAGIAPGFNPSLVLKWSDDGGHTWSDERILQIGPLGSTAVDVKFNRLGSTRRYSGSDRIFELSSTDAFKVAIMDAEVSVK
jgi:probable HAF family extracellular repeat protein